MANVFLDDGTKTGTAPVGNGTIELRESVNTPDFPGGTWGTITPAALASLVASEPDRRLWKTFGGSLVEMSGAEKTQVSDQDLLDNKAAVKGEVDEVVAFLQDVASASTYTDAELTTQGTATKATVDAAADQAALDALGFGNLEVGGVEATTSDLAGSEPSGQGFARFFLLDSDTGDTVSNNSTPTVKTTITLPAEDANFLVISVMLARASTINTMIAMDLVDGGTPITSQALAEETVTDTDNKIPQVLVASVAQTVGGGTTTIEGRVFRSSGGGNCTHSDAFLVAIRTP